MVVSMKSLGLDKLSPDERISLANELWDSVEEVDAELSDEFKLELDRRIADHAAHPERAIPWEQVYAEAKARLKR